MLGLQKIVNFWLRKNHQVFTSLSLSTIVSLTGVSWLTWQGIAPQFAQAYIAHRSITLNRQGAESYKNLLRRAEAIARASAQRSFDSDILVTEVAVIIIGENQGEYAPILRLQVSRPLWRQYPDPQRWAAYFPDADSLLLFETGSEEIEQLSGEEN